MGITPAYQIPPNTPSTATFADRVLAWFDVHGRTHLPWQQDKTLYRVWLSEVMLQQTQVSTVMPYYQAFTSRFPTLEALATAHLEEVLPYWTGLGYYSRARNLHRAAQLIVDQFGGHVPKTLDQLMALPGIGRSTAGAILSLADQQHHPILDGNVKRILCRHFAIEGWPGQPAVSSALWALAESVTPSQRCGDFNQAMMDLGSGICRRNQPQCTICPLHNSCQALRLQATKQFPTPKPRKSLPTLSTYLLITTAGDAQVLLEKRPETGVWAGLWCFPQFDTLEQLEEGFAQRFGHALIAPRVERCFKHSFSHYHLLITPVFGSTAEYAQPLSDDRCYWHTINQTLAVGVPAPVKKLLLTLPSAMGVDEV